MSAQRAHYIAVGRSQNVDVEVHIDFRSRQDHDVEVVRDASLRQRVRVCAGIHFNVVAVIPDGLYSALVEGLDVQKTCEQALIQQLDHGRCDAAGAEGSDDMIFFHIIAQEPDYRQRYAAGTCLVGESVLDQTGSNEDLACVFRDGQLDRIVGFACGALSHEFRIADLIDLRNDVHQCLRDADRVRREVYQIVCDRDDLLRVTGIYHGVSHGAERGRSLLAVHVAHIIAAGRGDERNVDSHVTILDGSGSAAMRPEYDRCIQQSSGDLLAQFPAHAARLQSCNDAFFDIVDQTFVGAGQG